jgi:hypothetical protein
MVTRGLYISKEFTSVISVSEIIVYFIWNKLKAKYNIENSKVVIGSRKRRKDGRYNGQKTTDKNTSIEYTPPEWNSNSAVDLKK